MMLNRFEQIFTDDYKAAAKRAGYSVDEIVTLASVIEGEAGSDADRPLVSSVFHNRLNSATYPYLESCATVQYILGERKPILSNSDIRFSRRTTHTSTRGCLSGRFAAPARRRLKRRSIPLTRTTTSSSRMRPVSSTIRKRLPSTSARKNEIQQ